MNMYYTQKRSLGLFLILMILTIRLSAQTTVVLRAGGDPLVPGDWGDAPAGTANVLSDFSSDHVYNFTNNNSSITLNTSWGITANSTVSIGDGTNTFTLNYSGTAEFGTTSANVNLNNNAFLILLREYNFNSTKTVFSSTSTVVYSVGTSSVGSDSYNNLIIANNVALISSTLLVNGRLTVNSNITFSFTNNSNMTLNCPATTMNGSVSCDGTGTITLNGTNFSNLRLSGNQTINQLNVNGTFVIVSNLLVTGNFSLNSGIFILSGNTLTLNGNVFFVNSSAGVVRGSLTSSIILGGSGTITNSLRMDNTSTTTQSLNDFTFNRAGLSISFGLPIRIRGTLSVLDGTVNAGTNTVFIMSDVSRKGRIGLVGASGAITGSPIIQVFKPSDATGWVNLCSGGVTGKFFTDWNNQFAITCPSGCPNGSVVGGQPFTSVYSYSEAANTTDESDPAHYIPLAGTSTSINSTAGYWVYLGNNYPNSTAMTLTLSGTVNTKGSSGPINLTRTGASAGPTTGWNLVGNPYPSPITVASFIAAAGGSNIDLNSITAYNATTDTYVLYTTGSNTAIPMGQAFMVRALNNTSFTPDESWKTATADNTPIQKINPATLPISPNGTPYYFNDFLIDLESQVVPKTFFSQAYFTFDNIYTSGFDNGGDAYSMASPVDPGTPRLFSISNSEKFLRNALPTLSGSLSIPIQVSTGYPGQYTLRPMNLAKLPSGACVVLHDLVHNTMHDLRSGAYTTTLLANQNTPQFELVITLNAGTLSSQITEPLCKNGNDGQIIATGSGNGPWNYIWKDHNNYTLAYATNVSSSHTLSGLGEGVYKVEVNTVGTCELAVSEFTLDALTALPTSQFFSNAPLTGVEAERPVSFSNVSQNGTEFTWDFGDGVSVSSLHATHAFVAPGTYTVKLLANNGTCQDTDESAQEILVLPTVVGIGQYNYKDDEVSLVQDAGNLFLQIADEEKEFTVSAFNLLGQELMKEDVFKAVDGKIVIPVKHSENLIFVKVSSGDKSKTFKVVY